MKRSGIMIITFGAVIAVALWVAGYIYLPNVETHRNLSTNPPIQSSVAQNATATSNATTGGTTGGNAPAGQSSSAAGSETLVNLPKIAASQIHLVDTTAPGYKIFTQTCTGCHGQTAEGGFGPPLYAIGKYWNEAQLNDFITKGGGGMPPNGTLSSSSDVQSVAKWLSEQKG